MTDFGDLVRTDLPNGTCVYYRESDHSYWRDVKQTKGKWCGADRLTGVSTVVGPLDFRPDNLLRWAARANGEGVAALAADGLSLEEPDDMRAALGWLASGESIWSALADARLLFSDRRDDAAQRGTNVHELGLHALAQGQPMPDLKAMTDEERGYARGVMEFWLEHDPEVLQAEQVVFSDAHGVAGRFDLRARLHGSALVRLSFDGKHEWRRLDGAICMVDAKTSGFIPNKHHAQLAGYDLLSAESGFGRSNRLFILQFAPDGSYELVESRASQAVFLNALQVYRDAGQINREAGQARKAAEQLRAAA